MRIHLAPELVRRRRFPPAIDFLGSGETGFLREVSPDSILSEEQMYVLARHEIAHIAGQGPKLTNPCPVDEILTGPQIRHPGRVNWSRTAGSVVRDMAIFALHEESWTPHEIDRQCVFMGFRPVRSKCEIWKSCARARALGRRYAMLCYWNHQFERWGIPAPRLVLRRKSIAR